MLPTDSLYLAPLQGFTDFHFRNAFQRVLGDIDGFYAPYLKMNNDGSLKDGPKLDVLPVNNPYQSVIPQIMANCVSDFLVMADYLSDLGYTEANWNLGCPYPMVAKRELGAGILHKPEKVVGILEAVIPVTNLKIGLKMRMGYADTSDILTLLPALNHLPLTEIIVHARYGKQLYLGECDHDRFQECLPLSSHKLVYNGDIKTVDDFKSLKSRFPSIVHWMIGRGAVANPFIFEMIQEDSTSFPEDRNEVFYDFLIDLLESHLATSNNDGNVLLKMKHYWEYFSSAYEDGIAMHRKVKKTENLQQYEAEVRDLLLL